VGIRAAPEQLQPVRVDPARAKPEEVLERHPEVAPALGVLRDEGGADEDGISHTWLLLPCPRGATNPGAATTLLPLGSKSGPVPVAARAIPGSPAGASRRSGLPPVRWTVDGFRDQFRAS